MEATSARMANRERYAGWQEPAVTPLQRYIQNACDFQNFEPNLALDLEIADVINAKKGSTPREAAIAIVNHVNNRNPNVSLLALTLLDICVKNCGYPFHLQISTKEFLNELVRRFPERPPIRYSRVQHKILELIEEWRQTICQNSKYKEDFGFIRDMHRLLTYKGYMFPEVKREDAAVLNPSEALRSADEMEAEEQAAQSAKLQELIRRGTPQDLQEANKLMKVMAGFDNRHKTDYRAKAAEEVSKVQQKARILEEMLQHYVPGDESINDGTWEDLGNALASAHPKIQRMCEEESNDTEAVAKLLEINDSIHRTLERYKLTKKGDIAAAAQIPKGTLGTSGAGVKHGANNELSLIDLGTEEEQDQARHDRAAALASNSAGGNDLEDDLLGLSLQDEAPPQAAISLGPGISFSTPLPNQKAAAMPGHDLLNNTATNSTAPKPNYDLLSSFGAAPQGQPSKQASTSKSDPFAALSSSASRTSSPFQFQAPSFAPPPTTGSRDHLNQNRASTPSLLQQAQGPRPSTDEEWTFTSALPDDAHDIVVVNSTVAVQFTVSRSSQARDVVLINSSISNNTAQPLNDLTFQLAVTKGYSLKLQPQSGRHLQPLQRGGIVQKIELHGVLPGKGTSARIRWKMSYSMGGSRREEQGEISSLGIS